MSLPEHPYAWLGGLMSAFRPTWFLCGGWAVDAWLGRQTREHGDADITIFHDDQRALYEHLDGWSLIAHGAFDPDVSTEPWDGRLLDATDHVHARPPGKRNLEILQSRVTSAGEPPDGFDLEILLNERDGDEWVLEREPRVAVPVARAFRRDAAGGLPAAVPAVLMYFKAMAYRGVPGYPREHDAADFLALMPLLAKAEAEWLRRSMAVVQPDHPWLAQFED